MSDFVICVGNDANPASLILGKVYRRLLDAEAESHAILRVVDEDASEPTGYLYPASIFAPIELPESARRCWQRRAAEILRQAKSQTPDPVVRSRPRCSFHAKSRTNHGSAGNLTPPGRAFSCERTIRRVITRRRGYGLFAAPPFAFLQIFGYSGLFATTFSISTHLS